MIDEVQPLGTALERCARAGRRPLTRRRVGLIVGALMLLGAVLRVGGIARESLWLDEGVSVNMARMPIAKMISATAADVHPPLYYLLLHGWTRLAGLSEAGVRSMSAAFSILGLWWFWLVARRVLERRVALGAFALFAVAAFQVYYAHEARNYALLSWLTLAAWHALLRWRERPRWRDALYYVAAAWGLFYTHVYGAFFIAAQMLYLAGVLLAELQAGAPELRVRARRRLWAGSGMFMLVGLGCLPWAWILAGQVGRVQEGIWIKRPTLRELAGTIYYYSGSVVTLAAFFFPSAWALLRPAPAWALLRPAPVWALVRTAPVWALVRPVSGAMVTRPARRWPAEPALLWLLLVWLIVPNLIPYVLSLFTQPIYLTRGTIGSAPALFMLVAYGLATMPWRGARLAVIALALLGSTHGLYSYYTRPHREPWRETARWVESQARPGDLLVFDSRYTLWTIYQYYSRRDDVTKAGFPVVHRLARRGELEAFGAKALPGRDRVWLIVSHSADTERRLPRYLGERYRLIQRRELIPQIEVYQFEN